MAKSTFDDVRVGDLITVQILGFKHKAHRKVLVTCRVSELRPYEIMNDEIELYFLNGKWRSGSKAAKLIQIQRPGFM